MAIENFELCEPIREALRSRGINALFEIQALTFNQILAGKDLVGQARTGTGKTLSFALPVIELLLRQPSAARGRKPRVLVMAPTRELAIQVRMNPEDVTLLPHISMCIQARFVSSPLTMFVAFVSPQVENEIKVTAPMLATCCIYGGSPFDKQGVSNVDFVYLSFRLCFGVNC